MDYKDIIQLSDKDLHLNLKEERELLQKLKFSHAVSPIENPGKIKASRKLVASYMTEINRRRHQKAEQA